MTAEDIQNEVTEARLQFKKLTMWIGQANIGYADRHGIQVKVEELHTLVAEAIRRNG